MLCTRGIGKPLCAYIIDVLGMEIVAEFGSSERKIILLDTGDGSHIALFQPTADSPKMGNPAANNPVNHFALATTDACAALEHVCEAGHEITLELRDVEISGMKVTIAFFKGPSGEVIEFSQTH